jgi:hypothetical protein
VLTAPFRFVEVPFDKDASITALGPIDGAGAHDAVVALARTCDDLFVFAHGWNNDVPEAQLLYSGILASLGAAWTAAGLGDADTSRTGVAALYWPSKRFDEGDLISGGAAAIADPAPAVDYRAAIATQIANLADAGGQFSPADLAHLQTALNHVPNLSDPAAQDAYVKALAALFPATPEEDDGALVASSNVVASAPGADVLNAIGVRMAATAPVPAPVPSGGGGAGGSIDDPGTAAAPSDGSASAFDPVGAIEHAAWMLLNVTTYYVMKERGGTIGSVGAAPLVAAALAANPALRVHLVGHSFGGRLVSSLANALPEGATVASIALLQAAYSHYGLAPAAAAGGRPVGAFRDVIANRKVRGEIAITHSEYDWAVGAAYPIASAFHHDNASAIPVPSTANSEWGGMGASGAMDTPEAFDDTLLDARAPYAALPSGMSIRDLRGDAFISGHGDVTGPQVAWAILHGFAAARRTA